MAHHLDQTLAFLRELAQHNHKEWFDAHRDWYGQEKERFRNFTQELIDGVACFEPQVAGVSVRQSVFRINRDVRFSKDKRPYKINFASSISPGGRHSIYGNYYFHLQPDDQSFVGGGLYMPGNKILARIRQEIDYNQSDFLAVVRHCSFTKNFGQLEGERLKSAPKGYPKDHPMIEYLRMKSFVVTHRMRDDEVLNEHVKTVILQYFEAMQPLNAFLSQAVDETET